MFLANMRQSLKWALYCLATTMFWASIMMCYMFVLLFRNYGASATPRWSLCWWQSCYICTWRGNSEQIVWTAQYWGQYNPPHLDYILGISPILLYILFPHYLTTWLCIRSVVEDNYNYFSLIFEHVKCLNTCFFGMCESALVTILIAEINKLERDRKLVSTI